MLHPNQIDLDALTQKQREVLENVVFFIQEQGYPPSIQQLCQECGLTSTSTIHHHLSALKKKGMIDWDPSAKRSLTVHADILKKLKLDQAEGTEKDAYLPLLGTIAAGSPLQTVSDYAESIDLPEDLCPSGCYALRVKGDSMIEDHIMEGDIVIINPKSRVRDGDVVVALIDNEQATLKRIYTEPDGIRLQPANASMQPIFVQQVNVQGKVEAIIRKMNS
jgi:repressor LexA